MRRFISFIAAVLVAAPLFAQSERILLPIFTPPVFGAFGSQFHTDLRIMNNADHSIVIEGLEGGCTVVCPIFPPPFELGAGQEAEPQDFVLTGRPGRFISVPEEDVAALSMNLRVHDVSRSALNFGTEIPIVRERDFILNHITLVGVPTDPRFRNTLRVYSPFPTPLFVTVGDRPPVEIHLNGSGDLFDPAYAMFTDFPVNAGTVRVTVEVDPSIVTLLPIEVQMWAFITVTNNDTQAITTITPQPQP